MNSDVSYLKHIIPNHGKSFNIGTVVLPTASMQRIVTSIATKVTQLLIGSYSNKTTFSHHSNSEDPSSADTVVYAKETLTALQKLVQVTNKTTEKVYGGDHGVLEEIDQAGQNLLIAGEKMLLTCQVPTFLSENSSNPQLSITDSVTKCFQCLVILLLCVDNAAVRKIIHKSNETNILLHNLAAAKSMEQLVENFEKFSSSVVELHAAANKRCSDLVSSKSRTKMQRSVSALKHSMPMLATALNMAIKYPHNDEAVSAKEFAVVQVRKSIHDIVEIIKARPGHVLSEGEEIGLFIAHVQSLDKMLRPENRNELVCLELETTVQSLVHHIMLLSSYLVQFPELCKSSDHLVEESKKFIELSCVVSKLSSSLSSSFASDVSEEDSSEFGAVCRIVRGKLKSLRRSVESSVSSLCVLAFAMTTEPVQKLVQVLTENRGWGFDLKTLEASLKAFNVHCNEVMEAAKFASFSASSAYLYQQLQHAVSSFEMATEKLTSLIHDRKRDNVGETITSLEADWIEAVKFVVKSCAKALSLTELTNSIENNVFRDFDRCNEDIVNLDDIMLSKHAIFITGKSKFLLLVAQSVVEDSTKPLYRNGVLAHVKQLGEGIAQFTASSNQLIVDMACLSSQEAFLASASVLKSRISATKIALLTETNHPDITSYDRLGLRDFSNKSDLCGMISNMHMLNSKLAALGFEAETSPIRFTNDQTERDSSFHDVDDLLATSGPDVDIPTAKAKESTDLVSFGNGLLPLAEDLLTQYKKDDKHTDILKQLEAMHQVLDEIASSSASCSQASTLQVENPEKSPSFTDDSTPSSTPLHKAILLWKESLNESLSIIQVHFDLNEGDSVDKSSLSSPCFAWSNAAHAILGAALKIFPLQATFFKRYFSLSGDVTCDTIKENKTPLLKPNEGLVMFTRTTETLRVLLNDVVYLYNKANAKSFPHNSDCESTSSEVGDKVQKLLTECRNVSSDVTATRKDLQKRIEKTDLEHATNQVEISWIHVLCVACSAKLHKLSSQVDTVTYMVLGIRKIDLPISNLCSSDSEDYRRKIHSLKNSTLRKTDQVMNSSSLEPDELSKLRKVVSRIEITCSSIEKGLEFLENQRGEKLSNTELRAKNAFVLSHVMFLHQRFLLEVSRLSLVVKSLNKIAKTSKERTDSVKADKQTSSGVSPSVIQENIGGASFEQRLAVLTRERKDREKDLFLLLSDIDNEVSPASTTQNLIQEAKPLETEKESCPNESEC
nr:uncharacterized protein LOC100184888 [Ciona intestinalis]|eukprot:XP_002121875.1 uncharacterized protein LOC100184888 [Ciona intestinalis]